MKVLEEKETRRCRCDCGALIEFSDSDEKKSEEENEIKGAIFFNCVTVYKYRNVWHIRCPRCGCEIQTASSSWSIPREQRR